MKTPAATSDPFAAFRANPVRHPRNRKQSVHLSINAADCAKMNGMTEFKYQGWCNSATWTFNIYFSQERENHDALCALLKDRQTPPSDDTYRQALKLFMTTYRTGKMEPFDGDEQGVVNVRAIVDTLYRELQIGKPKA
jgi:hypothetical protein